VLESTEADKLLTVDCSRTVVIPSAAAQLPVLVRFLKTGTGGLLTFCVPSGKLLFLQLDAEVSGKLVSVTGNASEVELSFISQASVRLSQTANSKRKHHLTSEVRKTTKANFDAESNFIYFEPHYAGLEINTLLFYILLLYNVAEIKHIVM